MKVNVGGCKGWKNLPRDVQENWRTLDISPGADVVHDLNSVKPIALCNDVVEAYYASHVLEHVRMENQRWVFSELHRTLQRGGLIRIVVPDLSVGIRLYATGDETLMSNKRFPAMPNCAPPTNMGALLSWVYTPNKKASSGHCMGYDTTTLHWYLDNVGFKDIKLMRYGQCSPVFNSMDFRRYEDWCIFAEARK